VGTLWTTLEAAQYLAVTPNTLEHWRVAGLGPRFLRVGKRLVRYDPDAILRWLEENTQHEERA